MHGHRTILHEFVKYFVFQKVFFRNLRTLVSFEHTPPSSTHFPSPQPAISRNTCFFHWKLFPVTNWTFYILQKTIPPFHFSDINNCSLFWAAKSWLQGFFLPKLWTEWIQELYVDKPNLNRELYLCQAGMVHLLASFPEGNQTPAPFNTDQHVPKQFWPQNLCTPCLSITAQCARPHNLCMLTLQPQ